MAKATSTPSTPSPKPWVVSTRTTWDMDGSQHPSLTGPLRLLAGIPTEVEPDQVEFLLTLHGVVPTDPPAPADSATPETPNETSSPSTPEAVNPAPKPEKES